MPSIGTAKMNKALTDTVPAEAKRTAAVVAIENPGALPATPMMTDSNNDMAPAFNVAVVIAKLLEIKILGERP